MAALRDDPVVVALEETGDLESDALHALGKPWLRSLPAAIQCLAGVELDMPEHEITLIEPAGFRIRVVEPGAGAECISCVDGEAPRFAGFMLVSGMFVRGATPIRTQP